MFFENFKLTHQMYLVAKIKPMKDENIQICCVDHICIVISFLTSEIFYE